MEVILALALTAIANLFDLFKRASWEKPSWQTAIGFGLMVFVVSTYVALKMLLSRIKEKDQSTIRELKNEALQLRTAAEDHAIREDWTAHIRAVVDNLVEQKMSKARNAFSQSKPGNLLEAIDPVHQIKLIMTTLHQLMAKRLTANKKVRLAVYLDVEGFLCPFYSFDGSTVDCFSGQSRTHMQITNPEGCLTLMTQLYHSVETFRLIPDCEAAEKDRTFTFLRPDQRDRIKSIVAAKRVIRYANGNRDIVILTMDSDQLNFFDSKENVEIKLCCDQILLRLEFELIWLDIKGKVTEPESSSSSS
jgi:hypothetical protein